MAYLMLDVKIVLGCCCKSIQALEREMMQKREGGGLWTKISFNLKHLPSMSHNYPGIPLGPFSKFSALLKSPNFTCTCPIPGSNKN